MTSNDGTADPFLYRPRGERPYLLPFVCMSEVETASCFLLTHRKNRRLRHLHGISLRNLTLTTIPARHRSKTFDDDALPYSLSSPGKLLALNEGRRLSHSHSVSNLKQTDPQAAHPRSEHRQEATNGHAVTPAGGSRQHTLRRRSTLEWQTSSPKIRRRKVEDAIARHTADVFFSVHADGVEEPLYVSEIVKRTMNPDFRFFDLVSSGPSIARLTSVHVKFWARHPDETEWTFLLDLAADLQRLHYIGRTLENFPTSFPDNCVLFLLSDGIYASLPDPLGLQTDANFVVPPPSSLPANVETTSSYDALMKLSTLDACVQDALTTQAKLASEIETLIAANPAQLTLPTDLAVARDANASVHRAVNHTKNQIAKLKSQVSVLRKSIDARTEAMRAGRATHAQYRTVLADNEQTLTSSRDLHAKIQDDIAGQRRRIVADLATIYPVEPAAPPGTRHSRNTSGTATPTSMRRGVSPHPPPLSFAIRGLPLPNSTFAQPGISAPRAAAALGHVAHTLALLSAYLAVPLPYPVAPRGSSSTVSDPISQLATPAAQRAFPLSLPARYDSTAAAAGTSAADRFDYAVFLLNKDVEALAGRAAGLRVLDLRQTLPNLKYLVLVATAGRGEVPLRKAGGVRGLLAGRAAAGGPADAGGGASGESSRRGSEDSGVAGEAGRAAEAVRRRLRET